MKSTWRIMRVGVLMMVMSVCGVQAAGSLDPTNAPSPTMRTLEEIYNLIAEARQDILVNRQLLESLVPARSGFNMDFCSSGTGLTFGAASGQIGPWAKVQVGTTTGLTNTAGQTTSVNITLAGRCDCFCPATTLEGYLLRYAVVHDDDFFGPTPFSVSVTGLAGGQYDIYYYFHSETAGMSANGVPMNNLSGGSPDALGAQGSNWDVVTVFVAGGAPLAITDSSVGSDGLGGIQIVPK